MSELQLQGHISQIKDVQEGTSKSGKEWKKLEFVIKNNDGYEGAEQEFAFEVFGAEKVDNFIQYNKVGQDVEVNFNIRCNEYKGKHYTSLQAWMIKSMAGVTEENDLPFS